jgi:hypothetical protein
VQIRLIPIVLATAAASAAGCGGDDGGKLSKADFIAKADKACVASALRPKAPPQNAQQAAQQTAEEATARKELQGKLKGIEPPADLKADYDDFLAKSENVIARLESMSQLAKDDKRADYAKADAELAKIGQARETVADRIGFKRCGQPFTAEERKAEQ